MINQTERKLMELEELVRQWSGGNDAAFQYWMNELTSPPHFISTLDSLNKFPGGIDSFRALVEMMDQNIVFLKELWAQQIFTVDLLRELAEDEKDWNAFVTKFVGSVLSRKLKKWYKSEGFGMEEKVNFTYSWQEGHDLSSALGREWLYQWNDNDVFSKPIQGHYEYWKRGLRDKQNHPLFLCFSGPGTGKSRFLDEFHGLVQYYLRENEELSSVFESTYVFKVSFENGTGYGQHDKKYGASFCIGSRMMFQLLDDKLISWGYFSETPDARSNPETVLRTLAKSEGKELNELSVIVLIDGLQKLPHESGSKDSLLYQVIALGANMSNAYPCLVTVCCAATVYEPFRSFLADSKQHRVFVTPPVIDGKKILRSDDPSKIMLIEDMGGHGRALEALCRAFDDLDEDMFSFQDMISRVVNIILQRYDENFVTTLQAVYKPLMQIVFSRRRVLLSDQLEEKVTVEDIVGMGLIRYNRNLKTLDIPMILLHIVPKWADMRCFTNSSYGEMDHTRDENQFMLGNQCWQHWEDMNVRFRILKSRVFHDEDIPWNELHAGAEFGAHCDEVVHITELEFEQLYEHKNTKSVNSNCDGDKMYLSAPGNPSGDAYCCFEDGMLHEVHQYKHIHKKLSLRSYQEERDKAASERDFFIFFTTSKSSKFELPARSALVDDSNWKTYYGPYWARAFYTRKKDVCRPSINTGNLFSLTSVVGVGKKRAHAILAERKENGSFHDPDEAYHRTKIPKTVLTCFQYI